MFHNEWMMVYLARVLNHLTPPPLSKKNPEHTLARKKLLLKFTKWCLSFCLHPPGPTLNWDWQISSDVSSGRIWHRFWLRRIWFWESARNTTVIITFTRAIAKNSNVYVRPLSSWNHVRYVKILSDFYQNHYSDFLFYKAWRPKFRRNAILVSPHETAVPLFFKLLNCRRNLSSREQSFNPRCDETNSTCDISNEIC